VTISMV